MLLLLLCCLQEWKGDFSDESDMWTDELRAEVGADDSQGDVRLVLLCPVLRLRATI